MLDRITDQEKIRTILDHLLGAHEGFLFELRQKSQTIICENMKPIAASYEDGERTYILSNDFPKFASVGGTIRLDDIASIKIWPSYMPEVATRPDLGSLHSPELRVA
jgi:hypothetical protein